MNGAEEIKAAFYANGFDFNYDNLPTLTLSKSEDILQIGLSDNFDNTIEMEEDYYTYTDGAGVCEKATYELTKGNNNTVLFSIKRRGIVRDEEAIYYLANDQGIYVFKIILPLT